MELITNNLDIIATIPAGLYSGSSLYQSQVEWPSLEKFSTDQHWSYFQGMFNQNLLQQVLTTLPAGIAALGESYYCQKANKQLWLTAGCIFIGILPYTYLFMGPTIRKMLSTEANTPQGDYVLFEQPALIKKTLLERYKQMHLVRTVASIVGFSLVVYGLSKRQENIILL
ncbi:unnamed protein product [Didymodactylos carnosus]|uniref:DUF1772 domain-containing protein n=1 Tax=Didymodactylos carnosus TaxID=1234261 RepID=A0A814E4D1_9BILA|nr:unnamed protein product [Didymodactylos carnosus]CAF3738227.1 unnamed protein product [Didymodactylos carnosus]